MNPNCTTIPDLQAKIIYINLRSYISVMRRIYEEWWSWRESNQLHQIGYNYMILLNNIRLLKSLMGQV